MKPWAPYVLMGLVATAMLASAQDEAGYQSVPPNPSYDGRYAFARLRYAEHLTDPCTCPVGASRGPAGWQHDYPEGERNLMRIATDLTTLDARTDSSVVVSADDPQLMKYPILYLSEPACWRLSESDVKALRTYLLKGGFLIVDDFSICTGGTTRFAASRRVFEEVMRRVLPNGTPVPVDMDDPTLNVFFRLDPPVLKMALTRTAGSPPEIYGIYERNDPKRRLMVAANYNTVIHRYWVWEAQGVRSVGQGNEAYKLGINYLLYGFTH